MDVGARGVLVVTIAIALLVGLPVVAVSEVSAQPSERQMYVSGLGADGAPVADLTVDDFTVREDGVLREVLRVGPATDPMQVAVLVDNSGAMWPYLRDVRDGLGAFIERIVGENRDHEVAVITVGERPTIVEDYSRSLIGLQQAIGRIGPRPDGNAPLLDAIYSVGQGLQRRAAAAGFETSCSIAGRCRREAGGSICCKVKASARRSRRSPTSCFRSTCSATPGPGCWCRRSVSNWARLAKRSR